MFGFNFIYRKAQATVDNALAQLLWGLLMVVPLLIGGGFAVAAAATYLHRYYEPEIVNLILAGAFLALSAVMAIGYAMRRPDTAASEEIKAQEQAATQADSQGAPLASFSQADRDILLAALTSAAPYAIRPVLSAAFRNLPLLLVMAVTIFVLTRPSPQTGSGPVSEPGSVPAE